MSSHARATVENLTVSGNTPQGHRQRPGQRHQGRRRLADHQRHGRQRRPVGRGRSRCVRGPPRVNGTTSITDCPGPARRGHLARATTASPTPRPCARRGYAVGSDVIALGAVETADAQGVSLASFPGASITHALTAVGLSAAPRRRPFRPGPIDPCYLRLITKKKQKNPPPPPPKTPPPKHPKTKKQKKTQNTKPPQNQKNKTTQPQTPPPKKKKQKKKTPPPPPQKKTTPNKQIKP
jgi:hypothetical protein